MKKNSSPLIEYTKHYKNIFFNVRYSYRNGDMGKLYFAAQPIETYDSIGYDYVFMYGQIDQDLQLQIGIREFQFIMTKEFHNRLGMLYEKIRAEFVELNNSHL